MADKYRFPIGVEYIWLGGNNEFRSKIRVLELNDEGKTSKDVLQQIPEWNYDGSSTEQASGHKSEIVLRPCACFKYPLIGGVFFKLKYVVLCETYTPDGEPLPNNHRPWAKAIFDKHLDQKPWYGIEQEYFLMDPESGKPVGFPDQLYGAWKSLRERGEDEENSELNGLAESIQSKMQGQYYCSVGAKNAFGRATALKHLTICLDGDLNLSGMNAEVAAGQWEFQVGPCEGIEAGDQLLVARYFLEMVAEMDGLEVCWDPKPIDVMNGSGCHTNFSTLNMRNKKDANGKTGLKHIEEAIEKLFTKHLEHMEVYGDGNKERMSGEYETSKWDEFSSGVGNRGCSVRIGNDTKRNECGYFEDRRPSSNMNPYLVTAKLLETVISN